MATNREPQSLVRAIVGTVSLLASLVVIALGLALLAGHAGSGGGWRAVLTPLGVLTAGGALLALGIALLIWELSIRYDIPK